LRGGGAVHRENHDYEPDDVHFSPFPPMRAFLDPRHHLVVFVGFRDAFSEMLDGNP